jgi:lysophospholipase L1-like esterase
MLLSASPAMSAVYVGGDSLGIGVGWAGRAPSVAKESVQIRGKVVLKQIARVPTGSVLLLSLGTNDAVGRVLKVDDSVAAIVATARARNIRIIWMGPPCVFKPWDKNAAALDQRLAGLLRRSGVTYVSMRDASLCSRSLRAGDGVHFNMTGYRRMWDRALAAADGGADVTAAIPPAAVAAPQTPPVATAAVAVPPKPPVATAAVAAPPPPPVGVVTAAVVPANVPLPRLRPHLLAAPAMPVLAANGLRPFAPFRLTIVRTRVVRDISAVGR